MKTWAEIDIEQALPLLSGFFSLNETYTRMRIVHPLTDEVKKAFIQIRKYAVTCLKTKVSERNIVICMPQLV